MSAVPFKVKAIFEYSSPHEDDLSFPNGQIITVIEEEGDEWYVGEYLDSTGDKQDGLFPRNFVERYEPQAPPRPTRTRPKHETVPVHEPEPQATNLPARAVDEPSRPLETAPEAKHEEVDEPPIAHVKQHEEPKKQLPVKSTQKGPPPPVVEKPSSFRDRIAAFNKSSAPPVAPIKPGAPASTDFVKKAFVAPPPSRNAYVPIHRDPAPVVKSYRRDEDPEIMARQSQDLHDAERAGLVPGAEGAEEGGEDAPRPTTLKERIALLQKEQQEQAMRRAEMALKEQAAKRPARQRAESGDTLQDVADPQPGQLSRTNTSTSAHRSSMEQSQELSRPVPQRRMSRDPRTGEPTRAASIRDDNEAEQYAGDRTEDVEGGSTQNDDFDRRSLHGDQPIPNQASAMSPRRIERHEDIKEDDENENEEIEEKEEDEVDAETRRKLELRERMAKMSGGMGMAGMFGAPMGMAGANRHKRPSGSNENRPVVEEHETAPAPRVPLIPLPGMERAESPERYQRDPAPTKEPQMLVTSTPARPPQQGPTYTDGRQTDAVSMPISPPLPRRTSESPTRQRSIPLSPTDPGRPVPPQPEDVQQGRVPPVPMHSQSGTGQPAQREPPMLPPVETRAAPPPPPQTIMSPGPGYEADEEGSTHQNRTSYQAPPPPQRAPSMRGPPPPVPSGPPARPDGPRSPPLSSATRMAYMQEPTSPVSPVDPKRSSRGAPSLPMGISTMPPPGEMRAPPPPPPTAVPSARQLMMPDNSGAQAEDEDDDYDDDEEAEYEGDYDTDIASAVPNREAFRSHAAEYSSEDGRTSEDNPVRAPPMPSAAAPPMPSSATRGVPPVPQSFERNEPPQPPQQQQSRPSADMPRSMPPMPPMPPSMPSFRPEPQEQHTYRDDDPIVSPGMWVPDRPIPERPVQQASDPSLYGPPPGRPAERPPPPPQQGPQPPPQTQRMAPAPVPTYQQPSVPQGPRPPQAREYAGPPPPPLEARTPTLPSSSAVQRRSVEQPRPSGEQAYIATEVDLGQQTQWWTRPNLPPPVFQNRPDVLCEFEESTTSKRGGRTTVNKDVYVLFADYSQSFITARFDSKDPADVALEQRHEAPPARPRQDVLEAAHRQFGAQIFAAASKRTGQNVLDGSPQALVIDLVRSRPNALLPVGTRAYGVCIYLNLANATVQQYDEIRPGDIISFRNAKFQGKHGAMHAKYSEDVGKPDHVGVVAEWDGAKRKVRVFEQGREGKKGVKVESFRVSDLRSGEVKVWRVIGRDFVGWS